MHLRADENDTHCTTRGQARPQVSNMRENLMEVNEVCVPATLCTVIYLEIKLNEIKSIIEIVYRRAWEAEFAK